MLSLKAATTMKATSDAAVKNGVNIYHAFDPRKLTELTPSLVGEYGRHETTTSAS